MIIENNKRDWSENQAWSILGLLKSISEYCVDELKRDNKYKMNSFLSFRMSWKETDEYDEIKEMIRKLWNKK